MEWGITFLDELQKMKKKMGDAWADFFEEDPGKEKEIGEWVEKLPKFGGPEGDVLGLDPIRGSGPFSENWMDGRL